MADPQKHGPWPDRLIVHANRFEPAVANLNSIEPSPETDLATQRIDLVPNAPAQCRNVIAAQVRPSIDKDVLLAPALDEHLQDAAHVRVLHSRVQLAIAVRPRPALDRKS